MQQDQIGKKRRKEIREAINIRNVKRKAQWILAGVIIGGTLIDIAVAYFVYVSGSVSETSALGAQLAPTIIAFALLFVVTFQYNHFSRLNRKFKTHCNQYGVTKEDMKMLEELDKQEQAK